MLLPKPTLGPPIAYHLAGASPTVPEHFLLFGIPIDLNAADQPMLEALPGIGPGLAVRIIEYRRVHGPFRDISQLLAVPGIGPRTVGRIAKWLTVVSKH